MVSISVILQLPIVETVETCYELVMIGCTHLFTVSSIDRVVHLEEVSGHKGQKPVKCMNEYPVRSVVTNNSPISALKPGYMVNGVVTEVLKNGARLSLNGLTGEIFYYHLKDRVDEENENEL